MKYLQNRTAYYTMFVSELTGQKPDKVFKAISPIFLTSRNNAQLREMLENEMFASLSTAPMVTLYSNYITSFCKNESAFGNMSDEKELLELKCGVLQTMDEFGKTMSNNPLITLADKYDTLHLSVVYALSLYVNNKRARDKYIPILQRALGDADGIDACIALMFFEKERAGDRYAVLRRKPAFDLYPDVARTLVRRYKLDAESQLPIRLWDAV